MSFNVEHPDVNKTDGGSIAEDSSRECSSNNIVNLTSTDGSDLESFRQRWIQELQYSARSKNTQVKNSLRANSPQDGINKGPNVEQKLLARSLYQIGISEEKAGNPFKAVNFYAKACRIFPDIDQEFRVYQESSPRSSDVTTPAQESDIEDIIEDEAETIHSGSTLQVSSCVDQLNNLTLAVQPVIGDRRNWLCEPAIPLSLGSSHISKLPYDVMILIFHHVAFPDFDFKSVENAGMVSKGFRMLARDAHLWKSACIKVWGERIPPEYSNFSWREMFLKRPRINFHGVYLSKVVYTREGEHTFDNTYNIYITVEYFRFLRFFPDGQVLMYTSPEDPKLVVPKLKYSNCRLSGIKIGNYKLDGDRLVIFLEESERPLPVIQKSKRFISTMPPFYQNSFYITLSITSIGQKKPSSKLTWVSYSVQTNKVDSSSNSSNQQEHARAGPITEFNINNSQFKPFIFSVVRSYTAAAVSH